MANLRISALTASTTPLAGTEVLPIVQSSTTKQVSVANLTAGRSIAAKQVTITDAEAYLGMSATGASGKLWYAISGGGGNVSAGYFCLFNGTSGNKVMTIAPSTSEQFITDTSGNFQLVAGNLVVSSGKGIDFSATSGTGTSELLADYEEGTWTPNQGAGLTVVGAFSSTGLYTLIGRQVTVTGRVTGATSINTSGSGIVCTNLPFTVGTNSNSVGVMTNTATNNTNVYVNPGTATMYSSIASGVSGSLYFTVTYSV